MATVAECEQALHSLADRLASVDPAARKRNSLDRSLSCTLPDLGVAFGGELREGLLENIRPIEDDQAKAAQVKLTMSSDDLVDLMAGRSGFASAWANGRVKVDARVVDLLKLRSIF